ncbi:TM2 domain-containing protein [uncultured Flavobacterium sp.]|uniref:TM2 domain-containing protein n=1 Tax=uncultured Flavobacterium sp. TaxID=165435 RepID=UPI0030CA4600|tara:strand:+ start:797 stop:1135 length:339 start_codon:yes stop_codon:yes gene_type:complete
MDSQKVDMFMMTNAKFFEGHQLQYVREKVLAMDEDKWVSLQFIQFKDPTTALLISIFAGVYGIDRFYIGDTGMGVGKLLTCGGFGVWAIVDWFLIQGATKDKNMEQFNQAFM